MNITRILTIGCFCVLMASPSFAQNAPAGAAAGGSDMPQTKTFKVDSLVSGVDANKDGSMTAEELKAVGLTDRFFTFCDPDGDKKISKKEMSECKLPEALDMNKDGALTVEEVATYEKTPLGKTRGPGEATPK